MFRCCAVALAVMLLSMSMAAPSVAVPGPAAVDDDGGLHGELRISPVGAVVDLGPQRSRRLDLDVENGGDLRLELALTVRDVAADAAGAPRPADAGALPSAGRWLQLPTATLHLGPGERALLPLAVRVPPATASGGYVAQVVATSVATEPAVEVAATVIVRVATGSDDVGAHIEVPSGADTAAVEVTLDAPAGAVVSSARFAVTSWLRTRAVDVTLGPTVVLPGVPRTIRQPFDVPALPGGYRVDAALDIADAAVELTTTVWLWQRGVSLAVALGLLLLASTALVITARRRRRHAYADSEATEQERG
ncbi:MAG: hypothetical protein KY469_02525 [Actinobacteria bacterium]|nr:hypothetical protein [Actinomycetota bacterium]